MSEPIDTPGPQAWRAQALSLVQDTVRRWSAAAPAMVAVPLAAPQPAPPAARRPAAARFRCVLPPLSGSAAAAAELPRPVRAVPEP